VVDIADGCLVALPVINQALQQLRPVLEQFSERRSVPQINVECGDAGCVAIVNYIGPNREVAADYFREWAGRLSCLSGLWLQTGRKSTLVKVWGDERLTYRLPSPGREDVRIGFTPGGFSQVNRDQNRTMLEIVRGMADLRGTERLLDLYCGNGNISLPLAGSVATVTGIEEYEGSVAEADVNMRANGITNAEFICRDAGQGVRMLADAGRSFDLVILDPPRSGAPGVASEIPRLRPDRIIYISCDPATLARDCGVLAGHGYRVERSVPIDMFPQTYHLESVTLLCRTPDHYTQNQ
jgi:23S rRNA (uracil1939-C5)-methyltransferase